MMKIQKIHNLLVALNEGYQKRDIGTIVHFMENLFDVNKSVQLMGTSDQEIYCGYDSAKELFVSDWKYWGEFQLDLQEYVEKQIGSIVVIHLNAVVEQTFEDNEETYDNFLDLVKTLIVESDLDTLEVRQHESVWFLNHLLHPRSVGKRINKWPVKVDMVLSEDNSKYSVRQIVFSIPVEGMFPDERIHSSTPYQIHYDKELNHIYEINSKRESFDNLPELKCLKLSETFTFRDASGVLHAGSSAGEIFKNTLNSYSIFDFDWKNTLLDKEGDTAWFMGVGHVDKSMSEEQVRLAVNDDVRVIIEGDMSSKDKLFKIRRLISECNKEIAMGEAYRWPIRGSGTLKFGENEWLLDSFQLSYPTNIILEDKML